MWLIPVLMGVGYLLGSIPSGFLVVKIFSGQDVRQVGSGRTGGTNVMRAVGLGAGLLTAFLDILKGAASVWLAQALLPEDVQALGMALAGLGAILGHNYSIFLKFKGGAGGAPCVGGAIGLWWPSVFIILPLAWGCCSESAMLRSRRCRRPWGRRRSLPIVTIGTRRERSGNLSSTASAHSFCSPGPCAQTSSGSFAARSAWWAGGPAG